MYLFLTEPIEFFSDCEIGTLVETSTANFQSCYLRCKQLGNKAMSFEISTRDCYCGNSLETKASTGFKCAFIIPGMSSRVPIISLLTIFIIAGGIGERST